MGLQISSQIPTRIRKLIEPSSKGVINYKNQIDINERPNGLITELVNIEQFRFNFQIFEDIIPYLQKEELCPYKLIEQLFSSIFIEPKNQILFDRILQQNNELEYYSDQIQQLKKVREIFCQFNKNNNVEEHLLIQIIEILVYDPMIYYKYAYFMQGEFIKFIFIQAMFLQRIVGEKATEELLSKAFKHAFILFLEGMNYRLQQIKEVEEDLQNMTARGMGVR
ncbi:hypothetical protein PPERSA_04203 [Pseudocohnilembus persalinus]|uniref:Uncharacterized protein n=1 Tax=Pseudocohnilembus persalinus TaxID=266149 RepID=A0A0V0QMS5_PSEPJ|nr:hypothetical protein PPERSA_04203 [Pseudocohnilembus persalinus]|eukprot:KRX03651.1 hypothetical protein PPERSA_04203 [Pseudocohnilembus persalinus]